MKLILTQEVAGLGGAGDVVEVKDGYGRNYLVPARRSRSAGPGAPRSRSSRSSGRARSARSATSATPRRSRASSRRSPSSCRLAPAPAAGCSARSRVADVVGAVKAAGGPDVDKRRIELPGQIKTVGAHR